MFANTMFVPIMVLWGWPAHTPSTDSSTSLSSPASPSLPAPPSYLWVPVGGWGQGGGRLLVPPAGHPVLVLDLSGPHLSSSLLTAAQAPCSTLSEMTVLRVRAWGGVSHPLPLSTASLLPHLDF